MVIVILVESYGPCYYPKTFHFATPLFILGRILIFITLIEIVNE